MGCASFQKLGFATNESEPVNLAAAVDPMQNKAESAFSKGDYANSSRLYEKLVGQYPDNKEYLLYWAESLRLSGASDKADAQYDRLIAQDSNNLAAIEGRGLNYLRNGEFISALRQFNAVIKEDASRWRTINAIGVIYSISGKDNEARQYYNMALGLSKNNPGIINNIALGVSFGGNHEEAIALLKVALKEVDRNDPRQVKLQNNLAMLYGISGQMDKAEAILRETLPEPAVYNNLGFYAKIAADKQLALDYLSQAVASSPVYYEKAENNLQRLEAFAADEGSLINNDKADNSYESNDIESIAMPSAGVSAFPIKASRGKYGTPLPFLRP